MAARPAAILLLVVLAGGLRAGTARQAEPSASTRFATVDVLLDSGDAPLAAWQVSIVATGPTVRIVGIEGGAHPAFAEPPYYDERAMMRERVVIASFSTAAEQHLPRGRSRVATIHLQIVGAGAPEFHHEVQVAATVGGERIDVGLDLQEGSSR